MEFKTKSQKKKINNDDRHVKLIRIAGLKVMIHVTVFKKNHVTIITRGPCCSPLNLHFDLWVFEMIDCYCHAGELMKHMGKIASISDCYKRNRKIFLKF